MFSKYCTLYDVALISGQSQKSGLWQKPVEDWHVTFTYRLKPPTRPAIRWLLDVDSIWWPWGVHSHFECTKEFWAILTYREIFRGYLVGGLKNMSRFHPENWGRFTHFDEYFFRWVGWNHRPGTVPGDLWSLTAFNPRIPRFVMPASGERALGHQACPCVGVRASEVCIFCFKGMEAWITPQWSFSSSSSSSSSGTEVWFQRSDRGEREVEVSLFIFPY